MYSFASDSLESSIILQLDGPTYRPLSSKDFDMVEYKCYPVYFYLPWIFSKLFLIINKLHLVWKIIKSSNNAICHFFFMFAALLIWKVSLDSLLQTRRFLILLLLLFTSLPVLMLYLIWQSTHFQLEINFYKNVFLQRVFSEAEMMAKKYRQRLPAVSTKLRLESLPSNGLNFDDEAAMYANWKWFKFEREYEPLPEEH